MVRSGSIVGFGMSGVTYTPSATGLGLYLTIWKTDATGTSILYENLGANNTVSKTFGDWKYYETIDKILFGKGESIGVWWHYAGEVGDDLDMGNFILTLQIRYEDARTIRKPEQSLTLDIGSIR